MSGVVNKGAREDRAVRAGKIALAAKTKGRLVLDAALCALLVFAMLRPVTGQVVHEVVGALLLGGCFEDRAPREGNDGVAASAGASRGDGRVGCCGCCAGLERARDQPPVAGSGVAPFRSGCRASVVARAHRECLSAVHCGACASCAPLDEGFRDLARKPCGGVFQAGPAGSLVCVCHSWRGACRVGWFGAQWIRDSSSVARCCAWRADDGAGCDERGCGCRRFGGRCGGAHALDGWRPGCRFPGRWRSGRFRRQLDARCAGGEGEGASRECVGDVSARAPFCSRRIRRKVLRLPLVVQAVRGARPRLLRHPALALPGISGRNRPPATELWHCQGFLASATQFWHCQRFLAETGLSPPSSGTANVSWRSPAPPAVCPKKDCPACRRGAYGAQGER